MRQHFTPSTFTYKINDDAPQTETTVSGNSVTVPVSTNTVGAFTYTLVSISESSSKATSSFSMPLASRAKFYFIWLTAVIMAVSHRFSWWMASFIIIA